MWKAFQVLPRVLRNYGLRTRPSNCLEEDDNVSGSTAVSCRPLYGQATHLVHRLQHSDTGGRGGHQSGEEEQGPECEWREWLRCFRTRHFCAENSLFEALGWGSALVFGIQFTQNWQLENSNYRRLEKEAQKCKSVISRIPNLSWACLHHLALSLHISENFHICRILPVRSVNDFSPSLWPLPIASSEASVSTTQSSPGAKSAIKFKEERREKPQNNILKHASFPQISSTLSETWETKLGKRDEKLLTEQSTQIDADTSSVNEANSPAGNKSKTSHDHNGEWKIDFSEAEESWIKLKTISIAAPHNYYGFQHSQSGNYKEAVYHWQQSAEWGYKKAHYNLGVCYEQGLGVTKNLVTAMHHYKLAALQGHPEAHFNLAMLLRQGGPDIPVDEAASEHELHAAAEAGIPAAYRELGVLQTEHGEIKPAAQLFAKAAELNDTGGQYFLGVCYEHGLGVDRNENKASRLYSAAAAEGHQHAQKALATFYETRYTEERVKQKEYKAKQLRVSSSAPSLTRSFTHHLINQCGFVDLEDGVKNLHFHELSISVDDVAEDTAINSGEDSVVFVVGDVSDNEEWETDSESDWINSDVFNNVLDNTGAYGMLRQLPQRN